MTQSETVRDGRSGATPLLFVLVGLLLSLGIGLPLAIRLHWVHPIAPAATPVAGTTSVVIRGRTTPNWATMNRASQAYLQREGPARRGPLFEQAAAQLWSVASPGPGYAMPIAQAHVTTFLGDPDYLTDTTASGGGVVWAYLYDKDATKDANVAVHFDRNGNVELVRFGKHSANDFTDWQKYGALPASPATQPTTAPATEGAAPEIDAPVTPRASTRRPPPARSLPGNRRLSGGSSSRPARISTPAE